MSKKFKKNFRTRLQFACGTDDLRPVMQHLYFKDGYVICTDAHILIKQSLKLHHFDEEEIKLMEDKKLHRDAFKQMYSYDIVKAEKDGFRCFKGIVETFFYYSKDDGKFLNVEPVIPKGKFKAIDSIGLDLRLLETAKKVIVFNDWMTTVKLGFYAKNKAIVITPTFKGEEDQICIIMPVMIDH